MRVEVGVREVASDYLLQELKREDASVVGAVTQGPEALVLVGAEHGDFALHLIWLSGEWTVVDELDDFDFFDNGGRRDN